MCCNSFEQYVENLLKRNDKEEMYKFLEYYHEFDPCCVNESNESECLFAIVRKRFIELKNL